MTASAISFMSGCSNEDNQEVSTEFKTADNIADGAILQCFCWDFNTIKESLDDIAAAGFTSIQTSPINECLEGEDGGMELYGNGKWYYHYQPTDFKIGNYQLGSRDEFKAMCDEADKYGIKVLVDVIANHTTPETSKVRKNLIEAGGGSLETLYHKGNDKDITDYSDRLSCTTNQMGGLPDINTERPSFQDYFIKYIDDCIACGADGFRYDTAKHIGLPDDPKEDDGFENNFWQRVTTEVTNADKIFNYGEVLQGGGDRLSDYADAIGRTTASTYGSKIRSAIKNKFLNASSVGDYWTSVDPSRLVTWVESHDNYINDGTYSELDNDGVILGWSIITARKGGTPLFFDRPYDSNDVDIWGMNRIGTQGDDMYKDNRVRAVNFFRTAMAGEDEQLTNPDGDYSALIIERGSKGAVIVNTEGALKTGFDINLADGKYIDRADNKTEYIVKNGKLTSESEIPENSVVVLYNEGYVNYALPAQVGVENTTEFLYETDSAEITLTCNNCKNDAAYYSLDSGEKVEYKNGDKVTITPSDSGINTLVLTAENEQGKKTYERLVFSHKNTYEVKQGTKVYFEKPDDWDDDVFAYVYDDNIKENSPWPGKPMTKESDGRYSYTFDETWTTPYIIFNDGDATDSFQYPEGQGLTVEPDKTYSIN